VNNGTEDRLIQERYSAALATPVVPDDGNAKDGPVVAAGRRLRKLSTAEGAVIVVADLATRMIERVPVAPGEGDRGSGMQSTVVYRHDPERLATALATLLGVTGTASSAN
jgi:hypothetical protein